MNISIHNDLQSQAEYLCFIAKDLVNGCFERGGFCVLPYPVKNYLKTVYFPNLNLSPRFWKYLDSCPHHDLGNAFPPVCVSEISKQVPDFNLNLVLVIPPNFLLDCQKFLDIDMDIDINILLTPYGSLGSFRSYVKNGKHTLLVTKRIDTSMETFLRTLLLGFYKIQTRLDGEVDELRGQQRMVVVDYLLNHTFLNKYKPHLFQAPTPKMKSDSQKYLSDLGVNIKIYTDYSRLENTFSLQEKSLWDLLKNRHGHVVTFDEAAACVWADECDTKFSLYSLAKIVENIRKKARQQGINREIISTIRRQGYMM